MTTTFNLKDSIPDHDHIRTWRPRQFRHIADFYKMKGQRQEAITYFTKSGGDSIDMSKFIRSTQEH